MEHDNEPQSITPSVAEPENTKHTFGRFLFIFLVLILIAGIFGAYFLQQQKVDDLNTEIGRQKSFSEMANQACLGVRSVPENKAISITRLTAARNLSDDNTDGIVANFNCSIGQNSKDAVKGMEVAAVDSNGREMGAEVIYFNTSEQADKYHQANINPQRYWSVPNESLTSDIPSFKYFTSYVFGNPLYFDAYAVKGNTILRVTLPCDETSKETQDKCTGDSVGNGAAVETLRAFANSIEPLGF